jgi:hypothetical protein
MEARNNPMGSVGQRLGCFVAPVLKRRRDRAALRTDACAAHASRFPRRQPAQIGGQADAKRSESVPRLPM